MFGSVLNVDETVQGARHDRKARPQHPTGWEPGAQLGESSGVLVPQPRPHDGGVVRPEGEPWDDHLRRAGLDPELVEVQEPVEIRTWDAAIGNGEVQTMVYFRARIVTRDRQAADEELRAWVRGWRPTSRKRDTTRNGEVSTLVVAWADPQIGKDDGDGTAGTVERWMNSHGQVQDRWRELKKQGVGLDRIVVASLGDIVEGCTGHYSQQTYRVELNNREQRRTARQVIVAGLKTFSDIAPVTVLPVGGNHGEVRNEGASFTDFADNVDVAVVEDSADILMENDRFDNVTFHIPQADLTQTVDLHGTVVGLAHGHQAKRGGSTPAQKLENWWQGQMKGRQPIGDADLLLSGHYHHLLVQSIGPRTHMQAPALDGGSEWWVDTSGLDSPAGVLSVVVGEDGWDHLRVLPARRG